MDNKVEYYELLAKFLSNELTSGENERLQQLISQDPSHEETMKFATQIWKLSNKKFQLADVSTEAEWQRLKSSLISLKKPAGQVRPLIHNISLYWKIAASILIIAVVGFLILNWNKQSSDQKIAEQKSQEIERPETGLRVYKTDNSMELFYLPDGSKVLLNKHSTLTFSIPFNDREVMLKGAGFFDVEKDENRVFTIHTENVITQVLGTSFNLRAYEESDTIVLALKTGKVKISEPSGKEFIVMPGEKVFYFKKKQVLTKNAIAPPNKSMPSSQPKTKDDAPKDNGDKSIQNDENNESNKRNERTNPAYYLKTTFQSQKNRLNQTIVEGTITNVAVSTSYTNIQIKVSYQKRKGRKGEQTLMISDFYKIAPGESLPFRIPLMDVFTRERDITVEVIDAKVITN